MAPGEGSFPSMNLLLPIKSPLGFQLWPRSPAQAPSYSQLLPEAKLLRECDDLDQVYQFCQLLKPWGKQRVALVLFSSMFLETKVASVTAHNRQGVKKAPVTFGRLSHLSEPQSQSKEGKGKRQSSLVPSPSVILAWTFFLLCHLLCLLSSCFLSPWAHAFTLPHVP